ncbi:MAG: lipid-A-disaccharide synthase [Bacteroidia bacterium]|nr:lipid-A-disaccharide synthase [Bacteroidia bacterium]MDW8088827.1 lipid-A-disaccharide synthase [Bacteroidia bacterium]
MGLRLYWVVGELSGEQHAVRVIQALHRYRPDWAMRGLGGNLMQQVGVSLLAHWQDYAVVGFVEVVRKLPHFIRLMQKIKKDILAWRPDRVILVDYPGFNLRLAQWLGRQGIPITYFIPPQLWAWAPGRVRRLRQPDTQILCILPFEPKFYASYGLKALYVGHPLVTALKDTTPYSHPRPYIALLPGSRAHEVRHMLPVMAQLPSYFPEFDFLVSRVSHLPRELYERLAPGLTLVEVSAPAFLMGATAAVITSGTATLEAALVGTPAVIGYKGNPLSYHIARRLVRVHFIGLPNLILNEAVFPELIQKEFTPEKVATALRTVLSQRTAIQAKLAELPRLLGEQDAATQAAEAILQAFSAKGKTG